MSTDRKIVASIDVWHQVSSDYQASGSRMVKVFSPDAQIGDVIAWAKTAIHGSIGWANLVLTEDQEAAK